MSYRIKEGVFSLVGNYLRPSNNYRQSSFNINAVVLILIICKDLRNWKLVIALLKRRHHVASQRIQDFLEFFVHIFSNM